MQFGIHLLFTIFIMSALAFIVGEFIAFKRDL